MNLVYLLKYFIKKKVAELLEKEKICFSFNKKELEIYYFREDELKQYSEKLKKQREKNRKEKN